MARKPSKEYLKAQSAYLSSIAEQEGVRAIGGGVYARTIESGAEGGAKPSRNSVVGVFYKGELSTGHIFDSVMDQPYPETLRLSEVIEGWQIALSQMHIGDRWVVYIPADKGYGDRTMDDIPGGSALIFDIKLANIY